MAPIRRKGVILGVTHGGQTGARRVRRAPEASVHPAHVVTLKRSGPRRPLAVAGRARVRREAGVSAAGSVARRDEPPPCPALLARHGYGVLLYDARGRGESDGSENNYGWDWAKDVAGALDFLKARGDVDADRIGALGLSTGADVLLEVAADRTDIAALVADGAAAGSFEDWHRLRGTELGTVPGWMMFTTIRVLSGDPPGPALEDQVRRITSPTLLVSAGTTEEREFNELYAAAARGPVEHWNLPGAQHTHAIHTEPELYDRRVVGFFDRALGDARRPGTSTAAG
jgi:uncharacterized protein